MMQAPPTHHLGGSGRSESPPFQHRFRDIAPTGYPLPDLLRLIRANHSWRTGSAGDGLMLLLRLVRGQVVEAGVRAHGVEVAWSR